MGNKALNDVAAILRRKNKPPIPVIVVLRDIAELGDSLEGIYIIARKKGGIIVRDGTLSPEQLVLELSYAHQLAVDALAEKRGDYDTPSTYQESEDDDEESED